MGLRGWMVVTWGALACAGCVPHRIMGRTLEGRVYAVPHTITIAVPEDDQDSHSFQPEMSDGDKAAAAAAMRMFIDGQGWTEDQVKQTSPATSRYDCHGLS